MTALRAFGRTGPLNSRITVPNFMIKNPRLLGRMIGLLFLLTILGGLAVIVPTLTRYRDVVLTSCQQNQGVG